MEKDGILELYADFLICNTKQATATNLSHMVDGKVSHDSVTRMLSGNEFKSIDLRHKAKPIIRNICPIQEAYEDLPVLEQPILSIDDTIDLFIKNR